MTTEERILEAIAELAKEKNCSEYLIDWHLIAIRLAEKLNNGGKE